MRVGQVVIVYSMHKLHVICKYAYIQSLPYANINVYAYLLNLLFDKSFLTYRYIDRWMDGKIYTVNISWEYYVDKKDLLT